MCPCLPLLVCAFSISCTTTARNPKWHYCVMYTSTGWKRGEWTLQEVSLVTFLIGWRYRLECICLWCAIVTIAIWDILSLIRFHHSTQISHASNIFSKIQLVFLTKEGTPELKNFWLTLQLLSHTVKSSTTLFLWDTKRDPPSNFLALLAWYNKQWKTLFTS